MKKNRFILAAMSALLIGLAGCSTQNAVTPDSTGIWDHYLVYPISYIITQTSHIFHDSYGIGIIAITLLIRIALAPLVIYIQDNSMKMRQLQPEVQLLREQYAGKNQEAQRQLTQEMMQLYSRHGVHPMMGCIPAVLQMFILMALYHAIVRTKAIAAHTFLWFSLGTADPLHILPVLAAIATFAQYLVLSKGAQTDQPMLQQQMRMMRYMMPLFILMMSFHLAAAIGLYWVVGNTWMVLQSLYIERRKQKRMLQSVQEQG